MQMSAMGQRPWITEANFLFPGEFPVEGLLGVWKRFYSLQNDDLWAIVQVFLVMTYQEN